MMFDNGDVQKVLDVMKESVGSSKKEVLDVVVRVPFGYYGLSLLFFTVSKQFLAFLAYL